MHVMSNVSESVNSTEQVEISCASTFQHTGLVNFASQDSESVEIPQRTWELN